MVDRRGHAFLDPAASEPVHRQQVEAALQRLAKLIAANTTADGALSNRVTELEDAPASYTAENARDDIGAALVAGTDISITVNDPANTITIASTASAGAPANAQYLCLATNATLTAERVFVPSTGLSAVDGGANGNYTLSCTITQYTDEMARDALGTALVAGHGCDITVNDGADTITVDVDETEFATGPGLITPAMLNNGTALSVLARASGTAGARADVASAADGEFFCRRSGALTWSTLTASDITIYFTEGETLVDIDCTAQATNDWNAGGDGTYALGGFNWTIANTGVADTLGPVLATGLRWNASASATVYTNASRTACNISIPVLTLTPTFVPWGKYLFEIYCSSLTLPNSGDMIMVGLFADQPGTDHVMMGGRRNTAGTQESATTLNASTLGVGYTDNNFGVQLDIHGTICNSGTYSGGFVYTHQGGYQSNGANNTGCFDTSLARWVIAFPSSATGNADATIARIRVRRIG
jgi:hypothetical protein